MEKGSSLADFGTRTLDDEQDVFEHNAWDNVEFDEEMEQEVLEKIKTQTEFKVSDEQRESYDTNPANYWNQFYAKNTNKFFKDRQWLKIEFPELFENLPRNSKEVFKICEIGCGAGNTVFPFLEQANDANVFAYACDYSSEAVDVVKSNELYDTTRCKALVFDITNPNIPADIELGTLDVCICVFVLSAIHPRDWETAAENIFKMLKPGGLLLFRDYGRYDLAQVRMKKNRLLEDNFYCRGDGTRVYFFTNEELEKMFFKFEIIQNAADKRLIVNRLKKVKMYRNWLQGKFRKPLI
ncbi:S-adenosyl-L-methionine-dependent methyltransferase [Globomyces pollinis-pini]|nr:S-adenosyl-L-methionine-dependent methyltransferase [Globomyces pollinis-pini]